MVRLLIDAYAKILIFFNDHYCSTAAAQGVFEQLPNRKRANSSLLTAACKLRLTAIIVESDLANVLIIFVFVKLQFNYNSNCCRT